MKQHWRVALMIFLFTGLLIGLTTHPSAANSPQPPFPAFRKALDEALTAKGFDPEHQTFHFVILMDNVRSADPTGEGMDAIVSGLLDHYLVSTPEASDEVSFETFQLNPLPDHTRWNLPFSAANAQAIKQLIPLGPEPEGSHQGGNDKEAALLTALKTISDPQKAVYIVLGDTEKSQTPSNEPAYALARDSADFKRIAGKYDMIAWTSMSLPTAGPNPQPIYFRLYLPAGLTPLGALTQTTRSGLLAKNETSINPPSTPPAVLSTPVQPVSLHEDSAPIGEILQIMITVFVVGGVLWYFFWLRASREVQIGPSHGRVQYGTPTFIVEQENQLILTDKPSGIKVARLEVALNGDVIMQGEGFYELAKKTVVLTRTRKSYWLKDNRDGGLPYEIIANRVH